VITQEKRSTVVRYWFEKAEESMASARREFEAKIRMEREDPERRYLVYAPSEEPDYESDWLLDIRLYSRSFRADRASIILDQLGHVHP